MFSLKKIDNNLEERHSRHVDLRYQMNRRSNDQQKLKLVHGSPEVPLVPETPNLVHCFQEEEPREAHLDVVIFVVEILSRPSVVLEVN